MNTYELTHKAKCPNGDLEDHYEITIKSHYTIPVETIIDTLLNAPKSLFQEDLATFIRSKLGSCTIVVGWHHGVKITSERQ
jgi:hypothetical protein